jgi:hypothetical protein
MEAFDEGQPPTGAADSFSFPDATASLRGADSRSWVSSRAGVSGDGAKMLAYRDSGGTTPAAFRAAEGSR